ncbi:MAG: hypothetical protein AAGA26_10210 [Pseudomonadota bacterium]
MSGSEPAREPFDEDNVAPYRPGVHADPDARVHSGRNDVCWRELVFLTGAQGRGPAVTAENMICQRPFANNPIEI